MIGETLGSYEVKKKIGEGGMGVVYLAKHRHIDRMAAIKVLRPQFSAKPDLVARFFAEARSANLVKHVGIVEIYDCAVHADGNAYIVMEYLEGQTLGAALERLGRVDDVTTIADLSWQIAAALQAAHDKLIVHRDLKPDNVFLTFVPERGPSPVVKILDFGIAKLLHSTIKATQTGSLLGTPLYMSPEQGRGAGLVDHRADIYSLGCIMFEMACGRPPFVRRGAGELIIAHASERPLAASTIQPSLPPELDHLIGRMLAKDPADRPQTMQEVATALDLFRVDKRTKAATKPFVPDLDDGETSLYQKPAPVSSEGAPASAERVPTSILPPSQPQTPRSVIDRPLDTEHSWIARAQQTWRDPPPRRAASYEQPPSSGSPTRTMARQTRFSLGRKGFWIGVGVVVGGVWLAVVLLVASALKPALKSGRHPPPQAAGTPPPQPSPSPALLPRPAAEPPSAPAAQPSPAEPPPAPAAQPSPAEPPQAPAAQPSSATPTVAKGPAAPERARHQSHRPAASEPIAGAGAESLAAAREAFNAGDYIASGIQAKRAASRLPVAGRQHAAARVVLGSAASVPICS